MKHPKSKLLAGYVAEARKADRESERFSRRDRAWVNSILARYPFDCREPVFCWLWVNHDEVAEIRSAFLGRTWHGIAMIMQKEGVKGSRGEPPNANSVRRVWGRVCADIRERAERKAAEREQ